MGWGDGKLRRSRERMLRIPTRLGLVTLAFAASGPGCRHAPADAGRLPERGYLWQREWTPAVAAGFREAEEQMDGVVVLGVEVGWSGGAAHAARANIAWEELRGRKVALAVRMDAYQGPFAEDDGAIQAIAGEVKRLLDEARANGVQPGELQLDFDCAQK